jgi:1,4-alpha-glucan branching enzyme
MQYLNLRSIILATMLALIPMLGFSQVITTDPVFPTFDEPLTIYFDATQADNQSLVGYTGNLYAHTGTIVTQGASWSNVIGSWGQNNTQPQLENIGTNLWKLEIENIRSFYNIPASIETVHQLAFVFREATASLGGGSWRQTEDLFVRIYDEPISVLFVNPSPDPLNPYFAELNEDVAVEVAANVGDGELESFKLFVNDVEVVSTDQLTISYTLTLTSVGRTTLRARAESSDGLVAEESVFVTVNPDVVNQARPAGIEDGITYHDSDPSKVTLSMWAPNKDFVYVIGDFNGWEVNPDYFMKREINGENVHYWIEIDGLTPGEEYAFQYLIDGNLRMADLFSEKVLSPWNDHWISDSTYPNLKPYPHDFTTEMVTVIQPGREPFNWTDNNYVRPPAEELIVYELLIRDFLDQETYKNLADTLDYLHRLGVNAIELMPVSNFDGNDSWGYNPNFHLALDKAYGPAHEFKRFVNEAHNRGMAVILDVVYNHATGQSPLVRLYGTGASNNPLLGNGHEFNVFNHLNHNHPYIQYWLDRANRHWVERYRVDGYRFDLTKGFANNFNSSNYGGYNAQRIGNLKRMADQLWAVDPDVYIILEHFTANSEETELANHRRNEGRQGMMFWGNANRQFSEASMGYHANNQSDFRGMYYKSRGWNMANLIGYMESHDEQWLMLKNRKFGNSSGSYNIRDLSTALNRQKLAGAFFLTNPGPKMLWQFGELGYGGGEGECLKPGDGNGDCLASDPGRTGRKPVRWEYREDSERYKVYQTWQWILKARHENPVFHSTETNVVFHDMGTANKVITMTHSTMDAVIIGNFGVQNAEINPRFTRTGTWYDYFTGESISIGSGQQNQSILVAPGEFHIFTTQFLETPPSGLVGTSVEGNEGYDDVPMVFNLHQNYPNPFNPTTSIRYDIAEAVHVNLTVYNILGQRVATLVNEARTAGSYTVNFDATRLSSGTYFIRMQAGNNVFTNKMMLVK